MIRHLIHAAISIAISKMLCGCGGGGGPSPSPGPPGPAPAPPPPPGPCACTDLMKRGHCTACSSDGSAISCKSCSAPYTLDASPDKPEHSCIFKCPSAPEPKPGKPTNVQGNNGVKWPTKCLDSETTSHFFGIGDWGGMCGWDGKTCTQGEVSQDCKWTYDSQGKGYITPGGPCPMPNRGGGHGPFIGEIEGRAQQMVAARMQERYDQMKQAGTTPQFIVNVGDNFYPGGINLHCGKGDLGDTLVQFQQVWKNVYPGPLTDELEWMSVLGNHDYGGVCYVKGWDQQIWYTYHSDTWVMPGQYFKRSVQYKTFKIDFFFVDGNWFDTDNTGVGGEPKHNICNRDSNPGPYCELKFYPGNGGVCDGTGPTSGDDCPSWFNTLWNKEYKWLMQEVPASDAEWQIIVMHYPGNYNLGNGGQDFIEWQQWAPAMGVDLLITGHTHFQQILYGNFQNTHGADWSETATVVTGGGGGVTTEIIPTPSGNDDSYGFMEFTVSLNELNIKTYSHGGVQNKQILRNQTTVKPVARKSDDEIIKRGLDPLNFLRRQEIAV